MSEGFKEKIITILDELLALPKEELSRRIDEHVETGFGDLVLNPFTDRIEELEQELDRYKRALEKCKEQRDKYCDKESSILWDLDLDEILEGEAGEK